MKKQLLFLLFTLSVTAQVQIGSVIDGEALGDLSGFSVALSSDGTVLAIGAPNNDGFASNAGHVRVYKKISNAWVQQGTDIDGFAAADNLGTSIALSADGNTIAVGAPLDRGKVRIFKFLSGAWTQQGIALIGQTSGDLSGSSVALSADGTIVAIGAPFNGVSSAYSGHVRAYKFALGSWNSYGGNLYGQAAGDQFGTSVSLSADGTILAVGAPFNSNSGFNSGTVKIYKNIFGSWSAQTTVNGEGINHSSGSSVSLSSDGGTVAIGSPGDATNGSNSGSVRIFKNTSNIWFKQGSNINGESAGDLSGSVVSLSGDGLSIAIGAPNNTGNGVNSGQVRYFKNILGVWTQKGIDIDGAISEDKSGWYVALSSDGNTVACGAPFSDTNGMDSGSVRVYDLTILLKSDDFVLQNFTIYPNPTSDVLNINLQENLQLQKVSIYSTLGQLIKSDTKNEMNISELQSATYYVEVVTDKGKATKTIIKE